MIISFSWQKYILQWIKVDFYLHMLLAIVFRIKITISRTHLEKCQKLESEMNFANQFISNMRVFLIHYHYIWFEMPLLGSAWTWMGPTTSCPQIPSAIIGVIGVFGSGVGYLLPGKGIKESLHWKEFLSPNPRFLFLPMPTEITARGYFPLHQPPKWKKLHWPLLSIASICEQLSLLQMEMRPKIATNGAMPLNADVLCSSPRVHMPDQINFNPSADRTDSSFTNSPLQQFVLSRSPGNNCMSAWGK